MCYVYLNVVVFHLYYGVKIILEYPKYITHLIILLFFIVLLKQIKKNFKY